MTYCCGWIQDDAAFLMADGAVTSTAILRVEDYSSFGELHAQVGSRAVEEAALKVNRIGETGLTFAGNAFNGRTVEECYATRIRRGSKAQDALEHALATSSRTHDIAMIVACYEGRARLLSYNASGCGDVVEHERIVQVGSIGKLYKGLSTAVLGTLPSGIPAPRYLAGALAIAQSFGSFDYLMEQGVGGAFTGLYVDQHGAHWQPDMLYVLHDSSLSPATSNIVSCIVRDDILIVQSGVLGGIRVFGNTLTAVCDEEHLRELVQVSRDILRVGRFDFVAFLNTQQRIVTVVEMARRLVHDLLVTRPMPGSSRKGDLQIGLRFGERLRECLTRPIVMEDGLTHADLSFRSIAYRPRRRGRSE